MCVCAFAKSAVYFGRVFFFLILKKASGVFLFVFQTFNFILEHS